MTYTYMDCVHHDSDYMMVMIMLTMTTAMMMEMIT